VGDASYPSGAVSHRIDALQKLSNDNARLPTTGT
jgi:hypothetical protein